MSKDRKLGFQPEQLSFGGAVELSLLGSGIAAVAFGDVPGDRKGSDDERIGGSLGLAPGAPAYDAKHFATERNRLLPDLEVPQASRHAHTMAGRLGGTITKPFPLGANARDQVIAAERGLRESPLVIFFTSLSSPRLLPVSGPPYGH